MKSPFCIDLAKLGSAAVFLACTIIAVIGDQARAPENEVELRSWLENMVWHHSYSLAEISSATGLPAKTVEEKLKMFRISPETKPKRQTGGALLALPYPGGRHPRIGFLEGAVDPQRETKLSIFTPWDPESYIVADIPEAIFSNLGLTYLAHTHVPTIWGKQELPRLEWHKLDNGDFKTERTLPNGIHFATLAHLQTNAVFVTMWLSNGTAQALTNLRVQNCIMLKEARGFNAQTNVNKLERGNFIACRNDVGNKWIISGFQPLHRTWANAPVPCLHSDPRFPDTASAQTSMITGVISFYEGTDIERELKRLAELLQRADSDRK